MGAMSAYQHLRPVMVGNLGNAGIRPEHDTLVTHMTNDSKEMTTAPTTVVALATNVCQAGKAGASSASCLNGPSFLCSFFGASIGLQSTRSMAQEA